MAEIVLSYSSADKDVAAPLAEALEAAGLDVAHSASDSLDADTLADIVERTPCVIVLWSANAAADPNRAQEVKLALSAWSTDRLVLAVLDDSELPAGFRDLHTFNLSADRQRAIDGIVERAREMTSAEPRRPPGEGKPEPERIRREAEAAKSTPPSLAKGRRSVLVMIGIVAMLAFAVSAFSGNRKTGHLLRAPAPLLLRPPRALSTRLGTLRSGHGRSSAAASCC